MEDITPSVPSTERNFHELLSKDLVKIDLPLTPEFCHMRPGLAVIRSALQRPSSHGEVVQAGLGVRTNFEIQKGGYVGAFTGVWILESDFDRSVTLESGVDHTFTGTSCWDNYPFGVGFTTLSEESVKYGVYHSNADRLMCVPRHARGPYTDDRSTVSQTDVAVAYSSGRVSDVASLLNESRKPNCLCLTSVVDAVDEKGTVTQRLALLIEAKHNIKAGAELTLDYEWGVAKREVKTRPFSPITDAIAVGEEVGNGTKSVDTLRSITSLGRRLVGYWAEALYGPFYMPGMPGMPGFQSVWCGPEVRFEPLFQTESSHTVVAIVVDQENGDEYRRKVVELSVRRPPLHPDMDAGASSGRGAEAREDESVVPLDASG